MSKIEDIMILSEENDMLKKDIFNLTTKVHQLNERLNWEMSMRSEYNVNW